MAGKILAKLTYLISAGNFTVNPVTVPLVIPVDISTALPLSATVQEVRSKDMVSIGEAVAPSLATQVSKAFPITVVSTVETAPAPEHDISHAVSPV